MSEYGEAEDSRAVEAAHRETLQATAWSEALQYAHEEGYFTRPQLEALQESNPYRPAK